MENKCTVPAGMMTTYTYGTDKRVSKITREDGFRQEFEYHGEKVRVITHNVDGSKTVQEVPKGRHKWI